MKAEKAVLSVLPSAKERARAGTKSTLLNAACNFCLFLLKLAAGLLSGSLSVLADAADSFSDACASLVTLAGFWLAAAPHHLHHPYGHGRIEYLTGLGVSSFMVYLGIHFAVEGVARLSTPQATVFMPLSLALLAISLLTKLFLAWRSERDSKRLVSPALHAAALDSLTDAFATLLVLVGALTQALWGVTLDGEITLCMAAFLLWGGLSGVAANLDPLLGKAPDSSFVDAVQGLALSHSAVQSMRGLTVHDYGPSCRFISFYVELENCASAEEIFTVTAELTAALRDALGCEATIQAERPESLAALPAPTAVSTDTTLSEERGAYFEIGTRGL